ncbi:unnamed protein product [Pleuronectes platessa]|uniref:Uncharacterized protein n=1 Tax=Pleuronectes platessa TaxID=8262 RepID=A0A9N7UU17_PLEPL|nr:unnamed protein product [Pleuronectes platessa]
MDVPSLSAARPPNILTGVGLYTIRLVAGYQFRPSQADDPFGFSQHCSFSICYAYPPPHHHTTRPPNSHTTHSPDRAASSTRGRASASTTGSQLGTRNSAENPELNLFVCWTCLGPRHLSAPSSSASPHASVCHRVIGGPLLDITRYPDSPCFGILLFSSPCTLGPPPYGFASGLSLLVIKRIQFYADYNIRGGASTSQRTGTPTPFTIHGFQRSGSLGPRTLT